MRSARFWALILKEIYSQENIIIPGGIEYAEFTMMTAPRVFVDDANVFLNVARIPDSMLKLIDPTNPLLVNYLLSIDSTTRIDVLPPPVS